MKLVFATYEHSRIGFPGVVLKWHVQNGEMSDAYIVEKGVILRSLWKWHNPHPLAFIQDECERFDAWVVSRYGNDSTVQG